MYDTIPDPNGYVKLDASRIDLSSHDFAHYNEP